MEKGFELFTERGIESVTMQEIADASLVGRATLFNYFNSKVDLVIALEMERIYRKKGGRIKTI